MDTNYGEKFKKVTVELLNLLKSIISELYEEKLVNFNENAVMIVITLLDSNSEDNLIWCLASVSQHWHKILSKDVTFITEDFPKSIRGSGLPLDTNILTCPFTCFKAISESDGWKDVDEEDWPVSTEDLDCIWEKINMLVRITCLYINNLRKGVNRKECLSDVIDPVYANIDLSKYSQMFNVNLR